MSFSNNMALLVFRIHKFFSKPATEESLLKLQEIEERSPGIKIPKDVDVTYIDFKNVQSELLVNKNNPDDKIVMYIHGGGFNSGTAKSRRDIALYVVEKLHYNVLNINYRLAPTYHFPCAQEDVFEQYEYLYGQYGKNIVVMGESAGGNLTLAVPFMCKEKGVPMPLGLVSISPVVQYDQVLESYKRNKKSDPIVDAEGSLLADVFFKDRKDICNPIAAPYHGDLKDYPPTELIVSDSETLLDDSKIFYEKLQANRIESELIIKHGMMHAFAMTTMFPETKESLVHTRKFINNLFK